MGYLDIARDLVKRLEACVLTGYTDSGGVPTNGVGHTGPEVKVGVAITQEVADHNLNVDLATADGRLDAAIPGVKLADHQRAALVSFVFNLGANPHWTIWQDINAGRLDDVPAQMRRFVFVGATRLRGLEHRREAEIVVWNTADLAAITAPPVPPPSSGFTRDTITPPAPVPPPPMAKASIVNKIVTGLAGAAVGGGSLASQVHDAVVPHMAESHWFKSLAVGASGVVVACAIVGLLIHSHQAQQRSV